MNKVVAIQGDATTTGGRVISASGRGFSQNQGIACVGDYASCPKCNGTGKIIEGANNFIIDGKPAAYDGCIVACGCPIGNNRIIANRSTIFVNVTTHSSAFTPSQATAPSPIINNYAQATPASFVTSAQDRSRIRLDAERLLACASEVCEKHLYYDDIKQAFINDVENFATQIVSQVDSGEMSYEEGSQKIATEEKSLLEQSLTWLMNGLAVLGGIGMIEAGFGLCATGLGCLIGAPLIAHGANGLYEGGAGIFNGVMNQFDGGNRSLNIDGPLRQLYQSGAQALGFDASVGNLAYDLIDLGVSVHGKLKLVPKLNEFGNPRFKLFNYAREDLQRAYIQMSKNLLAAEIIGDALSLTTIIRDIKNAFILDKNAQQVSMVVIEPETIINVEQIVDNCVFMITLTDDNEDVPGYFLCEKSDGTEYRKDNDEDVAEDGIEQ